MNQLEQIKSKINFACEKCGVNDWRLEFRTETITTLNVPAGDSTNETTRLDTTRTSQARVTVTCNKCGQRWNPA